MPKPVFFEEFEYGRVRRLRDVAAQIARCYLTSEKTRPERKDETYAYAVAATYYRRAAADSLLLGERTASSEWFWEAARCYRVAGMPYSVVMGALTWRGRQRWAWQKMVRSAQGVYLLIDRLGRETESSKRLAMWRKEMDEYRGERLGILAVPVDLYLDLFDAIARMEQDSNLQHRSLREALLPFVQVYSSALRRARRDKFHWSRLAMPFHPLEPDITGLIVMVARAAAKREVSLSAVLEGLPISHETLAVLDYILGHSEEEDSE